MILTTSIKKKIAAQAGAPGSLRTTSGYVRKTSPGPLFTTSDTLVPCSWAMWPRIEKVTQPASRHVIVFTTQVMSASLWTDPAWSWRLWKQGLHNGGLRPVSPSVQCVFFDYNFVGISTAKWYCRSVSLHQLSLKLQPLMLLLRILRESHVAVAVLAIMAGFLLAVPT